MSFMKFMTIPSYNPRQAMQEIITNSLLITEEGIPNKCYDCYHCVRWRVKLDLAFSAPLFCNERRVDIVTGSREIARHQIPVWL